MISIKRIGLSTLALSLVLLLLLLQLHASAVFAFVPISHSQHRPFTSPLSRHGGELAPVSTISSTTTTSTQLQADVGDVGGGGVPGTVEFLTELGIATVLGVAMDPLVEMIYTKNPALEKDTMEIKDTFGYGAADSISNAARVYGALILVAYVQDVLRVDILPDNLYESAPTIAFVVWSALTIKTAKRTLFLQMVSGNRLGRVSLYDRLIDFVLLVVSSIVILDTIHIDIGMGFQSIFAASGLGALIFSLASKDLAEQIAGGVILQAADMFEIGDSVRFGDGTEGTIHKVGLVETEIIGYDNIAIKLPNSQIIKQRISNISRMTESRVLQQLRFSYDDIDKVPQVLEDIKAEIQKTCDPDKLITDGSKPFAAVLGSYEADHILTVVNVHFHIQPFSQEYSDTKEAVLLAIARAAKKNNVKFAIPAIQQYMDSHSTKNTTGKDDLSSSKL